MSNSIASVIGAVIWFIISISLTIRFWDWIMILGEFVVDDFFSVLYWVGIWLFIILIDFMIPMIIVTKSMSQADEG